MEISNVADLTGGIALCIKQLKTVGFDASAYEIAKWAGVWCLIAVLILIIATFLVRSFRDKELPAAISEAQFALTVMIAACLIALPVVVKITSDDVNVDLASGDITSARRICEERNDAKIDAIASNAKIEAVEQKLATLQAQLSELTTSEMQPSTDPVLSAPVSAQELLGAALAIFYRSPSKDSALNIENLLQDQGAGVAVNNTDLTESAFVETAQPGDVYIVYTSDADDILQTVTNILKANGVPLREVRGPFSLKGPSLQILVF